MGSYVESVISPDEKVEYTAKVSAWSMLPLIVLGLLVMWCCLIGLLCWVAAFMRYKTTELVVTNKKLIAKFGFIQRSTIELLLTKVESIQVDQSIFGRMLNYGSIIVSSGGSRAPVPGIQNPLEFRRRFMEIQERAEKNS